MLHFLYLSLRTLLLYYSNNDCTFNYSPLKRGVNRQLGHISYSQ